MILLITLLAFLLGYALGKRKPRAQKQLYSVKRTGDVRGIGGFLTYDGTEQISGQ